jgi:hypothetical protein
MLLSTRILEIVDKVQVKDSGKFFEWDGKNIAF